MKNDVRQTMSADSKVGTLLNNTPPAYHDMTNEGERLIIDKERADSIISVIN